MNKKILISTGGSGGHVIPATIIYKHLEGNFDVSMTSDLRGIKFLNKDEYNLKIFNVRPISKNLLIMPFDFLLMIILIFKSISFLKKNKINVLISTGGYMSLPLCLAAKILNIINMPEGLYYQTSSADSTFYPSNVGCVGLFGDTEQIGVYELSIEAEVTVEILGSPISFQLPYSGGVMILDLVYSDGDYTTLNNFIPTFVIEVKDGDIVENVNGCKDESATNFNVNANLDDDSCIWIHEISLTNGWNLMSTYILPFQSDIIELFSTIVDNVVLVKNNEGLAYLPEWQFNGIGDLNNSQGYQIKVSQLSQLDVLGTILLPENTPITLGSGWNMISYLRTNPANAILILQSVTDSDNLVIAKDNAGNAYLPEWSFNGIGDFESGSGYQLKVIETQELIYLSNDLEY